MGDAIGSISQFDNTLRNRFGDNYIRRRIERIVTETHLDLLPAAAVAAGSEKQLLLSGTGTEVVTRAPRGGARLTTQATSPADNDQVQLAGVADTHLGKATAAANGFFRIDTLGQPSFRAIVSLPSITSLFAGIGLDENITDVDATGTAGDGIRFMFAPDNAATELAVNPGLTSAQYACWFITQKVAGADIFIPTTIPVVADRLYDLRIELDASKKPTCFIDNQPVALPSQFAAMTTDSQMAVMLGVEVTASAPAQKSIDVRYVAASRRFATS